MLLEAPLEGIVADDIHSKPKKTRKGRGKTEVTAFNMAGEFLEKHETAKVIMVIDTHCLENGFFVYTGASAESYKACSLKEASTLCTLPHCRSHILTDSGRFHPERGSAIPARFPGHPPSHAQESHSKPGMRGVGL